MLHPVLFGEYELTVDDKNRLLIPAEVRRAILPDVHGEALFLIIGINRRPWLYPEKYYQQLNSTGPVDTMPSEAQLAYDQLTYAMASRLEWDKQGRVLVPEKTLRRTGTGREITMIGAGNHLELWNREDWEKRFEELHNNRGEIAVKAKQARQSPTSPQ